ncbi:MAG: GTPase HflX [Fidelibacterota bacterium]
MRRTEPHARERTLLVGTIHGAITAEAIEDHLQELTLLVETAGGKVVGVVTQRLSRINPRYFVGKGKAEEIISQARALRAGLIVFTEELSPAQVKNFLQLARDIKIIDRSTLILDIFRRHAQTREARTQVELAQWQYMLPRLTRQWTHLERQMGGIGTRAGMGETQIEVDRRMIRNRIAWLKRELARIDRERDTQSKRRRQEFRVALVGYTNSGKSTLMKALSGADVFIQDQLFATLDTTVRKVNLNERTTILLSDTVGFIRDLPHHLIASFRSTLKEVVDADLILIVLDASSPRIQDHYETIEQVLVELGAQHHPTTTVLNKLDLLDQTKQLNYLKRTFPEAVFISAKEHLRLDQLTDKILAIMEESYQTLEMVFTYKQTRELALAQEGVEIISRSYEDDGIHLTVRGQRTRLNQIAKLEPVLIGEPGQDR